MSIARHAILTVTGNPELLKSLQELLGSDQPIKSAPSPREALAQAQADEPDLILLDSKMPGLDTRDLCLKLKMDPRTSGAPVILLAASEEEGAEGLDQGANDYLICPLKPIVARNRIRNYVDLGRCIEALRRFSLVDGITGIANRRRFDEFLTLEWRRNLRNRTTLSIVLMDLDHFRSYNEQYGVAAGDEALRKIATALNEATQRPGDLVACYSKGGFACVLPETDTLGAVSVAERMRAELATLSIPHEASDTAPILTMSVGTATRTPSVDLGPEDLIAMAERSLGDAKRAGRNRVAF
jgi:diguanylate cyclase (GGDEF)-like protein